MLKEDFLEELKEINYVKIEFELSQEDIRRAAKIFLEYLEQDDEEKLKLKHLEPRRDLNGDMKNYGNVNGLFTGYMKKQKKEGDLNNKEYFHYNCNFNKFLKDKLENCSEKTKAFIREVERIREKILIHENEIIEKLKEENYPMIKKMFNGEPEKRHSTTRFLSYFTEEEGEFIAKGHYDKGFATFAIGESHEGLRFGIDKDNLEEVNHKGEKVLFFPSLLMERYTQGDFKAVWHDVIQKKKQDNEISSRWAIVHFIESEFLDDDISTEDILVKKN